MRLLLSAGLMQRSGEMNPLKIRIETMWLVVSLARPLAATVAFSGSRSEGRGYLPALFCANTASDCMMPRTWVASFNWRALCLAAESARRSPPSRPGG